MPKRMVCKCIVLTEGQCGGVEVGIGIVRMALVWLSGLDCDGGGFEPPAEGVYKYVEVSLGISEQGDNEERFEIHGPS
jgi:hypothetical protein